MSAEHIRSILARSSFSDDAPRRAWEEFAREWNCLEHPVTQLRVKLNAAGVPMFGHQCLRCGAPRGSWLKRSEALRLAGEQAIPAWDDEVRESFAEQRDRARDEVRSTFDRVKCDENRQWWEAYNEYLMTAEWHVRRRKVMERANYTCEGCGDTRATQVHHLTYEHVGDEMLFELRAVCNRCHDKLHAPRGANHDAA